MSSINIGMESLQWLIDNFDQIALLVTSAVTLASVITAMTPTPKDDTVVKKIKEILQLVALNVKNSKPPK